MRHKPIFGSGNLFIRCIKVKVDGPNPRVVAVKPGPPVAETRLGRPF